MLEDYIPHVKQGKEHRHSVSRDLKYIGESLLFKQYLSPWTVPTAC